MKSQGKETMSALLPKDQRESVSKTATCKRCGSTTVTWKQGQSGKWYLTEVFTSDPEYGLDFTNYKLFHSGYCGPDHVAIHAETQALYDNEREAQAKAREDARVERERKAATAEFELITLCETNPEEGERELMKRIRELEIIAANPATMDYFVEFCREQERVKQLKAEIDLMGYSLKGGKL
jgi:hypothetical protein